MTNYLVDTSGGLSQVDAETDGNGNLTAYYVRVGDELLAVMRPGATAGTWSTRFVHSDGLGSVRVLTDETGATIDQRAYEAFGTKNVEAGSDALPYGFAGEPFEPTSKLAYHRARWMDARVGRFASVDPWPRIVRDPRTLHRYLYVKGNPVNLFDPRGLESIEDESVTVAIIDVLSTESGPAFHVGEVVGEPLLANAEGLAEQALEEVALEGVAPAAEVTTLTSAQAGEIIGWGTGQSAAAVAQTEAATAALDEAAVEQMAAQGVTREWVSSQLVRYAEAVDVTAKVAANAQLLPRIQLMLRLLELWPK
jgi:RHS repeat-associated protein